MALGDITQVDTTRWVVGTGLILCTYRCDVSYYNIDTWIYPLSFFVSYVKEMILALHRPLRGRVETCAYQPLSSP